MKIGIVTVYNSYNCGSFLQAYALFYFLQKYKKCEVVFLKRSYKRNKFYYQCASAFKQLAQGRIKTSWRLLERLFLFRKIQRLLPVVSTTDGLDLLIYGSDAIWNVNAAYFSMNWARYWGNGITTKKITYAVSVDTTAAEVFYDDPKYKKLINEFAGVAVRDEHTYEIANTLLEEQAPVRVVDPTMLIPIEEFQPIAKPCKEKDFILLYYFGSIPKKLANELQAFAKANHKKIIFFGASVPTDPGVMLGYYKAADYVITNTFHGNIFSILYNKNFISYGKEKKKVQLLLKEFGLLDRLLEADDDWEEALHNGVDFKKVNKILVEKRQEATNYLENFIV